MTAAEKRAAYQKAWLERHPGYAKAKMREWRATHREHEREKRKATAHKRIKTNAVPLTQARVNSILDYNQETGAFRWKVNQSSQARCGDAAGTKHFPKNGIPPYHELTIDGTSWPAHQVAWLIAHGYLPPNKAIEHLDGNNLNNAIANLALHPAQLTHEYARRVVDYDLDTGILRWRKTIHSNAVKGQECGYFAGDPPYAFIGICKRRVLVHRFIWFWMTGSWPRHQIDHKNRDTKDNRWENLRSATISQNRGNSKTVRTGLKGAYFDITRANSEKPWKSSIGKNGRTCNLGTFTSESDAHAAYMRAANQYYGEFARAK